MSENDQAIEVLNAEYEYEKALKQCDRSIATNAIMRQIDEIALQNNLTREDCIEVLEIVATLFNFFGDRDIAKNTLRTAIRSIIAAYGLG